jgi:predicted Zn-dependent protease
MKPLKHVCVCIFFLTLSVILYPLIPEDNYGGERLQVYVAGSGNVSDYELLQMKFFLEKYFSEYIVVAVYEKNVPLPEENAINYRFNSAFNATQILTKAYFDAGRRIMDLERSKGAKFDVLVIISDTHLFPEPTWNYVFGESLMEKEYRMCVLSTWYLKRDENDLSAFVSPEKYLTRLKLIGAHETGHTLGLYHVPDQKCLMAYTSTMQGLDRGGEALCSASERKLRTTVPNYLCERQNIPSFACFLKSAYKEIMFFALLALSFSFSRSALKKSI